MFTFLNRILHSTGRRRIFILDESIQKIEALKAKLQMIDKTVIIDHFITIRDLLISIQTPKSDAHRYSLGIIDHTIRGENVELLSLLIKTIDPSIKIIINSAKDSDTLVIKRIIRADEICNKKYDCILDIVKKQLQL